MKLKNIINKKQNGLSLTVEEINFFVNNSVNNNFSEDEIAKMLKAIFDNGMNEKEIFNLTNAMANSGEVLSLEGIKGTKADKHSTGGVSDSTTLIVAPILASLNFKMAKISGRGLGFTGGTLDKLEALPGFNVNQSPQDFVNIANKAGASIISQSKKIAPADALFYDIRNKTNTVDSIALGASSIMSKKLASNTDVIVLDVKYGNGAFMQTKKRAKEIAEVMVSIGHQAGKKIVALITDMNEPLGCGIGSNLEMIDVIEALKGKEGKLLSLSKEISKQILVLSGKYSENQATKAIDYIVYSGKAFYKFKQIARMHGANINAIDNTKLLTLGKYSADIVSPNEGYVRGFDTATLGQAVKSLGGSRDIDKQVGIKMYKKVNDKVNKKEKIMTLYANDRSLLNEVKEKLEVSFVVTNNKAEERPLIYEVIKPKEK